MKHLLIVSSVLFSAVAYSQQQFVEIVLNQQALGKQIVFTVERGKQYTHPIIAIWITTLDGTYIQTLYVSRSIGKGYYEYGKAEEGKWFPGERRRPAAVPYWAFSRGIREIDGLYIPTSQTPIPDAYTGATPQQSFVLKTKLDKPLSGKYKLLFEINQPFDFNDYWYNNKYEENTPYRTSGQPSVVYAVEVDFNDTSTKEYYMNPIGHGHPNGENGRLFTNLSTLTSALEIVKSIKVNIED
ncbi:MAG: hypothetical protein N2449_06855 [Bacteroidales bacterium]|nr:hypothetical protein [Bacteroidales bacterium]